MSAHLPTGVDAGSLVAGRYRLERKLAEGGVGAVYHALDTSTGDAVALKQLLPHAGRDARLQRLFQREYHTLAQIEHPRIIEVFDYGLDDGGPYYTMELLEGRDLGEFAPIPFKQACHYLRDVASCLSLLHTRRLLHRDLSPRNVRSTVDGRCKLLDFGTMATFGVATEVVGTPPLVAPECLRGATLDHRTDLYSLGALAYRLLTRRYAYRARRLEDLQALWKQAPAPPSSIVPEIPPALDELVLALLSLDPLGRPSHTAEVIDRLTTIGELAPDHDIEATARSYLVSTTLVGRKATMRRVERRLARAQGGRGGAWLIDGHQGVGKTRILEETALLAQLGGALSVTVRSAELLGAGAFGTELVRALWTAAPSDASAAAGDDPAIAALRDRIDERTSRPTRPSHEPLPGLGSAVQQAQEAVLAWLWRLCSQRTLVLLVDDLHRAPEDALTMLEALAMEAGQRPLYVVGTCQLSAVPRAPRALGALREQAVPVRLSALKQADTLELVRSVFGGAPNVTRLAERVHSATAGNPMQILALLQHMIETELVPYRDGLWVVPADLSDLRFTRDMAELMLSRCAALSPSARELAEACSVASGELTLELCLALWPEDDGDAVFSYLGELVQHDVLINAGDGYAWSQEALREALLGSMQAEQRRASHLRLGEALLHDATGPGVRIEAGRHLYLGGEPERGSAIIVAALPGVPPRGSMAEAAVPAFEAALAEYLRREGKPTTVLRLRIALVMSSVRDASARHSENTLRQLAKAVGLPLASRLGKVLPRSVALLTGILTAWARRLLTPRSRRTLPPLAAVRSLLQCVYAVLPVRSSAFDLRGLEALVHLTEPLRPVPPYGGVTEDLLNGAVAATGGRQAQAIPLFASAIARLENRKDVRRFSPESRRGMLAGAHIAMGLTQVAVSIRSSEPLGTIECLERFAADSRFPDDESGIGPEGGLTTTELRRAAHQLRVLFHLLRGETELATLQRRQHVSSDGGMYWQFELVRTLAEADVAIAALDLVALRHATAAVDQLLRFGEGDERLLSHVRETTEAATLLARGDAGGCVGRLQGAERPVGGPIGWERRTVVMVMALIEQDRAQEALALAREALDYLEQHNARGDRASLTVRCAVVQACLALHDLPGATAEVRILDAALQHADHPLLLATYHGVAAEVAHAMDNRAGMTEHMASAQHWAAITRSPPVIARLQKAAERLRKGAEPRLDDRSREDAQAAHDLVERVARMMADCRSEDERARRALLSVLEEVGATSGHLFRGATSDDLALAASVGGRRPLDELEQRIQDLFAGQVQEALGGEPSTKTETTMFEITTTGRPNDTASLWRVHVLHDRRGQRSRPIAALAYAADELGSHGIPSAYLDAIAEHLTVEPATAPIADQPLPGT